MKKVLIFGDGQIAQIIYSYFTEDSDLSIEGFISDRPQKKTFCNLPIYKRNDVIKKFDKKKYYIFIALSYRNLNKVRNDVFDFFKKKKFKFCNFISSKSFVSKSVKIGTNVAILDNCNIQPYSKINNNVLVWGNSVIGHHSLIKKNSWITSGSNVGGNSIIGENNFLGLNSTIGNMVEIGKNCFIGANSLVTRNINKNSVIIENDTKLFKLNSSQFLNYTNFK